MKRLSIGNIIFAAFLILLLIPPSRNFIQINLQKLIGMIAPVSKIKEAEQKTLSTYNIQLKGVNTESLNLSSVKGKVIFLNFWATWCPPCIAEMPELQKLQDKYKSNNNIVFAFISNEKSEKIQDFLKKTKYNLPCFQQASDIPNELSHRSIPSTYLIDKNGKIVLHKTGVANWNGDSMSTILNELLQE